MKIFIRFGFVLFSLLSFNLAIANNVPPERASDSLTLGQAFINLSLTEKYFDTLQKQRIAKILQFEENELASIKDSGFIIKNAILYNFTYSLLHYGKARLLFSNIKDSSRKALLKWKRTLDSAINFFNKSEIQFIEPYITLDPYFEFIGFTSMRCYELESDIKGLKDQFAPYFNNDIYPDFKRIFLEEKNSNRFYFDSLLQYTSLYGLPLRANILNLLPDRSYQTNIKRPKAWKIDVNYDLDLALDLISRYLQLNYVAKNFKSLCTIEDILYEFKAFEEKLSPANTRSFNNSQPYPLYNKIPKDDFFRKNLNSEASNRLFKTLTKITKPDNCPDEVNNSMALPKSVIDDNQKKYFFPIPAPFPSAFRYINNYKPGLKKMKELDDYLRVIFNGAGYKGHTQYYYVKSGYAMTTSLEAITKEGVSLSQVDKRWNVTVAGNSKFSLYEVFKSIFFATESEFRIFALVISPKEAAIQSSPTTIGAMQDLLINSYSSLPTELETLELPEKVLTILVYNFHQSDIGEVPMLDISKRLSVEDHLKKSGLSALLNNQ